MSLMFSMFEKKDTCQKPTFFFFAEDKISDRLKKGILDLKHISE